MQHIGMNILSEFDVLFLHEEAETRDVSGHGAGILSLRSQRKLIPEEMSNVASDGLLGKRHPTSVPENDKRNINIDISTKICLFQIPIWTTNMVLTTKSISNNRPEKEEWKA